MADWCVFWEKVMWWEAVKFFKYSLGWLKQTIFSFKIFFLCFGLSHKHYRMKHMPHTIRSKASWFFFCYFLFQLSAVAAGTLVGTVAVVAAAVEATDTVSTGFFGFDATIAANDVLELAGICCLLNTWLEEEEEVDAVLPWFDWRIGCLLDLWSFFIAPFVLKEK